MHPAKTNLNEAANEPVAQPSHEEKAKPVLQSPTVNAEQRKEEKNGISKSNKRPLSNNGKRKQKKRRAAAEKRESAEQKTEKEINAEGKVQECFKWLDALTEQVPSPSLYNEAKALVDGRWRINAELAKYDEVYLAVQADLFMYWNEQSKEVKALLIEAHKITTTTPGSPTPNLASMIKRKYPDVYDAQENISLLKKEVENANAILNEQKAAESELPPPNCVRVETLAITDCVYNVGIIFALYKVATGVATNALVTGGTTALQQSVSSLLPTLGTSVLGLSVIAAVSLSASALVFYLALKLLYKKEYTKASAYIFLAVALAVPTLFTWPVSLIILGATALLLAVAYLVRRCVLSSTKQATLATAEPELADKIKGEQKPESMGTAKNTSYPINVEHLTPMTIVGSEFVDKVKVEQDPQSVVTEEVTSYATNDAHTVSTIIAGPERVDEVEEERNPPSVATVKNTSDVPNIEAPVTAAESRADGQNLTSFSPSLFNRQKNEPLTPGSVVHMPSQACR